MEAAKAEFAAQRKQIEQAMEERIGFYRTALEGSEPERAAQLVQLDKRIDSLLDEVNTGSAAIAALETAKVRLEGELAGAQGQVQERERTLAATEGKLADLQESLTQRENELRALQERYDAAVAKAADDLAATQEELRVANEQHAAESAQAAALLEQTRTEAATLLEETRAEAARAAAEAERAMNQAAAQHGAEIARAENRIAGLTTDLETEKSALATLQTQYDETVEDLNAKLAGTKQALADTDAKLAAAIADAESSKAMLERQIADREARISELQQTIETERQQAADRLAETQRANAERLADLRTLYTDLSLLGGTQTDKGMLLSLADTELRFRIGGKELPKDLPSLDKIAELMQKYPKLNARIEGHTDSSGREETNLELSKERATAVMEALVERGVDPGRLTAEGFGQSRPIASNDTPFGRLKNRRVEVYVTDTE
jgi:outer membrane protein OmpA-like peptidoglycan-associated protein